MKQAVRLNLVIEGCATREEMNANIAATIERGYKGIGPYLDSQLGKRVHLCGAGPSLRHSHAEIPEGEHIMAVNSAIGYLLDQGRKPTWAMIWDASPICAHFAIPHDDVTYLISARCHPSVFAKLEGCKVVTWYAGGDHNISEYLEQRGIDDILINGGTAGVTRGIYLAYALGYRDIHIHGADSSFSVDGETHIRGSLVPERSIEVRVGESEDSRWFTATPEWCAQVEEIKLIYPLFTTPGMGASITCHGDGMFQHVVAIMKSDEATARRVAQSIIEQMQHPSTLQLLEGTKT